MAIIIGVLVTILSEASEKIKKSKLQLNQSINTNINITDKSNKKINFENDKIMMEINSMFYDFCFSTDTAKTLLTDNDMQDNIMNGILLFHFESEKLLEKILKIFLGKKYNFELGDGSYNSYYVKGCKFYIDVNREYIGNGDNFFEILYNDFDNIVDAKNNKVLIAKEFIVYCEKGYPKAIFVIVYDPNLNINILKRVHVNGNNLNLTLIKDVASSESINYLEEYIFKNL